MLRLQILGSCPVFQAQGSGCTDEAVQSIVANTKKVGLNQIKTNNLVCEQNQGQSKHTHTSLRFSIGAICCHTLVK